MTFARVLAERAAERPDALAFAFCADGVNVSESLTYAGLHERAGRIGAALPGDARVLLLLPPGLDYIAGIFGCFAAGAVAVSAAPPTSAQLDRALPRLAAIVADAGASVVLTSAAVRDVVAAHLPPEIAWVSVEDLPEGRASGGGEVAFLQYTSGSTASPKGVMLSHRNLLANCAAIARAFGTSRESVVYSWLPPYHDMGLIGGILHPVYVGAPCYVTSPITIIRRPGRWLEGVAAHRATFSGGPDFMYDLCVRRAPAADVDLSSWRTAVSGAEPVRASTVRAFTGRFAPNGLPSTALTPAYGLAEATLLVTTEPGATITSFDRDALLDGKAEPGTGTDLVSCGLPVEGHEVLIVDPATGGERPGGLVGEVVVAGPSVAAGYWGNPEATAAAFGGGRVRTGDLGFLHEGRLYLTGRAKEVLIVNGVNHHPHDLESLAEAGEDRIRPHCSAAFQTEAGVVVVAEVARGHEDGDLGGVLAGIRARVAQNVPVAAVVLVAARTVPKTTSGKIQRLLVRERLLAGELPIITRQGEP